MKECRDTTRTDVPDIGTEAKVEFLKTPGVYPEATASVEVVETHMSWVFLTERFVYKLKKPVRYEFLDFRTIEARRRNCDEEIRLNRRLAPKVYLGVVPLTLGRGGRLRLGAPGQAIDWLVKMRRLAREQMLDQAISNRRVSIARVRAVAHLLASFYRDAEPVGMTGRAYRERLASEIAANRHHLREPAYGLPGDLVERNCGAQSRFLASHSDLFDRRIIEAHGDLRPEHICLSKPPQIIDCLEFKREFRILDPADELSFLALECERLGASFVGPVVLDVYCEVTGDSPPQELICFYKSYRACLRAKISAWHLRETQVREPGRWIDLARTYLALAETYAKELA